MPRTTFLAEEASQSKQTGAQQSEASWLGHHGSLSRSDIFLRYSAPALSAPDRRVKHIVFKCTVRQFRGVSDRPLIDGSRTATLEVSIAFCIR